MLCESKQIYKNPKYRVIRYNNEYFMVDLVSTWITYFFPMINWFIPKKYAKISENEFERLNIVEPFKRMFLAGCRKFSSIRNYIEKVR